jgi:hypothetical protein
MDGIEIHKQVLALSRARGEERRLLRLARRTVAIEGLDRPLAAALERRWGRYLQRNVTKAPTHTVRVLRGGAGEWLNLRRGEQYRIEALNEAESRVIVSYRFALCAAGEPGQWRLALSDDSVEPAERLVENALRYLTARLALELGGFALHAAGVLREGQAFLFAGPSRSGKTTAVGLASGARSIGDDFAMVVPGPRGWSAPALPFDNAERFSGEPLEGLLPLAGVWRLYKAREMRVEQPSRANAVASLMGCAAFPWALPEQTELLLERSEQLFDAGKYAHLHFRRDGDIWTELLR